MADQRHLDILMQGVEAWNQWREEHPDIRPDLSGAMLQRAYLFRANLSEADLSRADLSMALLIEANLKQANLEETKLFQANLAVANLSGTDLRKSMPFRADFGEATLCGADFRKVILYGVNFRWANLSGADLSEADLTSAILADANLENANITGCSIYGISAWNVNLKNTVQANLTITRPDEPTITVDNLEVAQFIYLLLNNKKIRDVIDTITSKVVLILGRFTPERKIILDAIRDELRKQNYTPVLFDFEKPANRDLTETVSTLAHLARFIIVDLTDPSSAPHEVATIIPHCIVPVQPLLLQDEVKPRHEYAMFNDLRARYHWVLPTYQYQDISSLVASLKESIIVPAEHKAQELAKR